MRDKTCASALAFFLLFSHLSAAEFSKSSVDAVSGATINNACQFVYPISVTATAATIQWTEQRKGGTCQFCFGTDSPPSGCRTVTATERNAKTINLTSLIPSTTYHIYIEMSISGETPYAALGYFTTLPSSGVVRDIAVQSRETVRVQGKKLLYGGLIRVGDRILYNDFMGRALPSHTVSVGETSSPLPSLIRGPFCVRIVRGEEVVSTFSFVTIDKP